ncbi:MAG: VOC family protein [Gemmatimonadaceae bacterium]
MKNRSAPRATVTPILIYDDVGEAIQWLCRVFGFTERLRAEREGVVFHAQLSVAEGAIMLGRQGGPYRAPHGSEVTW